jgi:hypothetical protein
MAASKSAAIAELVAQLKAGAISKAELFAELQRLKGVGAAGGEAAGATTAPAPPTAAPQPAPRAAAQAPVSCMTRQCMLTLRRSM